MFYNFIIIGFIIALIVLSIFWAFNAVRRIEIEKNFCANALTSIAKLWRRANFIPEDAKERESLYLYRDFLRKFDENECKYPIAVKNGGVRAMTRKEYDSACGIKTQRNFSTLILAASILIAVIALIANVITETFMIGLGLALIMPVVQLILAMFLQRFNKEKNNYRDAIFLALKENSINFLSITKPFILVDAYPDKFGKQAKPLFDAKGELTEEQIVEVRDYIIVQKQAENKVELRSVNNDAEIEQMNHPQPVAQESETVETEIVTTEPVVENTIVEPVTEPVEETAQTENQEIEEAPLTDEEKEQFINYLVDDILAADVRREIKKQEEAEKELERQANEPVAEEETEVGVEPVIETATTAETITEPAEDDFSLEAIGQALDAEIEKRNKKR